MLIITRDVPPTTATAKLSSFAAMNHIIFNLIMPLGEIFFLALFSRGISFIYFFGDKD
jgi:hypothetical protein